MQGAQFTTLYYHVLLNAGLVLPRVYHCDCELPLPPRVYPVCAPCVVQRTARCWGTSAPRGAPTTGSPTGSATRRATTSPVPTTAGTAPASALGLTSPSAPAPPGSFAAPREVRPLYTPHPGACVVSLCSALVCCSVVCQAVLCYRVLGVSNDLLCSGVLFFAAPGSQASVARALCLAFLRLTILCPH